MIQALWLVAIFGIPLWLMFRRKGDWLLLWIVAATCTDICNVRGAINISGASVTGVLLIPYSARLLLASMKKGPMRWAAAHLAYLVVLGVVFGFAFPWPDDLGRPFNLQAQGRTILYLTREAASLSIAVFVAQQVAKAGKPDRLLKFVLLTTLVTSTFAVFERVTELSFYTLLTSGVLEPTYANLRVRGLNFEPRGLALVEAHAVVFCVLLLSNRQRVRFVLATLIASLAGLFLSVSTSGLFATAVGLGTVSISRPKARRYVLGTLFLIGLAAIVVVELSIVSTWRGLLMERVGTTVRFGSAASWLEEIVFRMEVYDTSAALFLVANPAYLFIGTGPGLISIPATAYLPLSPYAGDLIIRGLNSPPTMGWLLEIANGGFVSAFFWVAFVISARRSLDFVIRQSHRERQSWIVGKWAFQAASAIYLIAAGFLSSYWALFMGLGLGAEFLRQHRVISNERDHV